MSERFNSPEDYPIGKFANRTLARTVVFQTLYQEELNPGSLKRDGHLFLTQELPAYKPLVQFAKMLLDGTVERQEMLDTKITAVAQNWAIDRMSPTDRCVLRLAAFEILETDTPKSVVINEAVELAKKFGAKESQSFVNGILDKLSPDK